MLVLKSRAGVSAPASGDEQVTRRSGCSALLSERDGHRWPVVAAGSCGERKLAESAARATMQQRGAAGLGRRGRWASRSRARPVRWLHVRPARSYVCTPCAPRTAWRCCWSSLSQRSPRRVREVVATRSKLESSNGRASTSASASRSGECHRWVARGAGRSRGRRRRCRCPRSGARARRPRARARRPSRGSRR